MQDLITTSQVARALNKSESAIRKMANDGRLPVAARLGDGTRLFSRETIVDRQRANHRDLAELTV